MSQKIDSYQHYQSGNGRVCHLVSQIIIQNWYQHTLCGKSIEFQVLSFDFSPHLTQEILPTGYLPYSFLYKLFIRKLSCLTPREIPTLLGLPAFPFVPDTQVLCKYKCVNLWRCCHVPVYPSCGYLPIALGTGRGSAQGCRRLWSRPLLAHDSLSSSQSRPPPGYGLQSAHI